MDTLRPPLTNIDAPVAPSLPATALRKDESFYGNWDSAVNPKLFIQSRYRETAYLVKDKRSYTEGLVKYLEEKGAVLLERTVVLAKEKEENNDLPMGWLSSDDSDTSRTYLYKDNVVLYSDDSLCVYNPASKPNVIDEFKAFLKEVKDARVSILLSSNGQMYVDSIDFEPPVITDLALNYGSGFPKIHAEMVAKLNEKRAGLVLAYGPPGSGKSTWIKHLTSIVDREFIFIPIAMAGELSSPAFVKTLLSHKDAILILEDAEQALQSRDTDAFNSSTVSTLLNLTDGLLGTLLSIKVIATFNGDKNTIDPALLRRGRLMHSHTFDKLSIEDATKLAKHLNKDIDITESTSLADIYNAGTSTNYVTPVRSGIGFGAILAASTPKG